MFLLTDKVLKKLESWKNYGKFDFGIKKNIKKSWFGIKKDKKILILELKKYKKSDFKLKKF